jgi:hypothetical protein
MDKDTFVKIAPDYYATAILAYLYRMTRPVSREELSKEYSIPGNMEDPDGWFYFTKNRIFEAAVEILLEHEIINIIRNPFGPPIISPRRDFYTKVEVIAKDRSFPFYKYRLTDGGEIWLREALQSLDRTYSDLQISATDFDAPDREWEPLPLERDDPLLQKTIDAVDETIEKVRADNGYAAHLAEEREYVLDGLSAFSKRLKEAASISVGYIRKYAVGPLGTLLTRFKDNALGLAASVAREALKEWLKRKGITFLDGLF